jgi:exodeoxyribonuclease III
MTAKARVNLGNRSLDGKMKIASWNCKMAYRKKAELISKYCPDLVVVPECEYLGERTERKLWFGDNCKKEIGVFSYSDFHLELHKEYDSSIKYVIPIEVTGRLNFNLIAVCAMNDTEDARKRYVGQVYSAISRYFDLLNTPTIIIGDFNWNAIWDAKPGYPLYGNLADVIEILDESGIRSVYHEFFNEDFGRETKPTFFMHHNHDKPYHIDYCFASKNFEASNVEVGDFCDWVKKSDHVPFIVTFNDKLL